MFDGYKKYLLVRHCLDCGTDDGRDATTKKDAERYARQALRDGWETVACINTIKHRIEFVFGEPSDVLRKNTTIPTVFGMMGYFR